MARVAATISPRQRAAFWAAHKVACVELELSTREERESYRRVVMREECGKAHLAELSRTGDFDRVMLRFAKDAGDFGAAAKFAVADEARQVMLVRICCAQLMQLKGCTAGTTEAVDYLAGIVEQARIPCGRDLCDSSFWLDVAPVNLRSLFQMLDTHRRRMLRRLAPAAPMSFDAETVYALKDGGGVRLEWKPGAYAALSQSIRVNVRRSA